MAEAPDSDQKTLAASAKRKRDAAEKGDVLQSRDFALALVVLAGVGWLALAGEWFVGVTLTMLRHGLTFDNHVVVTFDVSQRIAVLGKPILSPLVALFATAMLAALAGQAALGSLGFRAAAFAPKLNRLDPLAGFRRIFGAQGLIELAKSLLKVSVLGGIGYWVITARLPLLMALPMLGAERAAPAIGAQLLAVLSFMAGGLAIIGLLDAPIQFLRRNARLRMTHQEGKEESKESDGSPENKQMARQRRHDLLNGSARRKVAEATVVLTNPTHFAIALRYRPLIDAVPVVVARGRGDTALAIRELAKGADVPLLEYPQLARAIYFTTRSGQPIASEMYIAVATILAFVFNLDREIAEGRGQPAISVPSAHSFDEHGRRTP